MSVETDGFLSSEMESIRNLTRNRFEEVIRECEEVSRRATSQLFGQQLNMATLPILTAMSLWARCVSGCQAAIILAERGMGIDALAMLRTAYENLFYCAAILKSPDTVSRLAGEDTQQRVKQAKAMLSDPQVCTVLRDEDRILLAEMVQEAPKSSPSINAFEAAEIAEMLVVYHATWRTLSLVAAHATLTSAGHAFGKSITDLQFGPSHDHLAEAFGLARDCLRLGLAAVAPAYGMEKA